MIEEIPFEIAWSSQSEAIAHYHVCFYSRELIQEDLEPNWPVVLLNWYFQSYDSCDRSYFYLSFDG